MTTRGTEGSKQTPLFKNGMICSVVVLASILDCFHGMFELIQPDHLLEANLTIPNIPPVLVSTVLLARDAAWSIFACKSQVSVLFLAERLVLTCLKVLQVVESRSQVTRVFFIVYLHVLVRLF
jgi:hypothetical protein